jgi:hypothetical protein
MNEIRLYKKPLFKMFLIQYGYILGLEAGLLISYNYVDFNFYVFQLLLMPVFLVLIFSKYNKSITTIEIDINNKLIRLNQNLFLILTKKYEISFKDIYIKLRWKWLLNYYTQVIEIKEKGKLIAVIPLKGSIWNMDELNKLIHTLIDLKKQGEIDADLG